MVFETNLFFFARGSSLGLLFDFVSIFCLIFFIQNASVNFFKNQTKKNGQVVSHQDWKVNQQATRKKGENKTTKTIKSIPNRSYNVDSLYIQQSITYKHKIFIFLPTQAQAIYTLPRLGLGAQAIQTLPRLG